jgi:DNA-binding MarR family transcriptional regulator
LPLTIVFSFYTFGPMDKANQSPFSLITKLLKVSELWKRLDSKPRKFGSGNFLSGSEINPLEVVGQNEGLSVTDLAARLGITKGAVSRTLKKMEAKKLVIKGIDPSNGSRITVILSTSGKAAHYSHLQWHESMDGGFRDYFVDLPEDKIRFLDEFLSSLEEFLKKSG